MIESRGVFTEIPFRGYSGWLCTYNKSRSSEEKWRCVSRFVDLSELDEDFPPDLTVERKADRPDMYGVSYDQGNWRCNVNYDGKYENEITATCTSWLPGARGIRDYPALYRYEPEDGLEYQQYGYTYLDIFGDGGAAKAWIPLGKTRLAGAYAQSVSFATLALSLFLYF